LPSAEQNMQFTIASLMSLSPAFKVIHVYDFSAE